MKKAIFLAVIFVGLLWSASVSAADRTVGADKTYQTIQAAYDAATSNDVIVVDDGVYIENDATGHNLLLDSTGKNITIQTATSTSGTGVVIKAFSSTTNVVKHSTGNLVLRNLAIDGTGMNAVNNGTFESASATGATIELDNVHFINVPTASTGVLIYSNLTSLTISGGEITGGTRGVYVVGAVPQVTISNNTINSNATGVAFASGGVTQATFTNNTVAAGGNSNAFLAQSVQVGTTTISGGSWTGGGTGFGLNIFSGTTTALVIQDEAVITSGSGDNGKAIVVSNTATLSNLIIDNSTITSVGSGTSYPGAVVIAGGGKIGTAIVRNNSTITGGNGHAFSNDNGSLGSGTTVEISDSTFTSNSRSALVWTKNLTSIDVSGSTFSCGDNASTCLTIGLETEVGVPNSSPITSISFTGNTVTKTGTAGHCALFGDGAGEGEISRNVFTGGNWGLVIKDDDLDVLYNTIYSEGTGVTAGLWGTTGNAFTNNTIVSGGSGGSFGMGDNQLPKITTYSTSTNNIVQSIANGIAWYFESIPIEIDDSAADYNLYHTVSGTLANIDDANLSSMLAIRNKWAEIETGEYASNDANSISSDPLLTNPASGDFTISYLSPAIDAGVATAYTTDYLGNPIYGLPDIGAYEYQPPYTMGTHLLSTDAGVVTRVYGDEKFRVKSATTTADSADLTVTIAGADKTDWLDIAISTWLTDGTYQKTFTASSTVTDVVPTFTIGGLTAGNPYTVTLDGATSINITGASCTAGVCTANGSGEITFNYAGGFSAHVFEILGDATGPTRSAGSPATTQPAGTTEAILSLTTDENATCKYSTTADTAYASMTDTFSTTGGTTHSTTVSALENGTTYTYYVRCIDGSSNANDADYLISFLVASPASAPSGSTAARRVSFQTPVISQLQAQLAILQAQLRALTAPKPTGEGELFAQPLSLGQTHPDVKRLQIFLNTHGFTIAIQGPGSPNHETSYFGLLTKQALARFQLQNQLVSSLEEPVAGYLGPKTRALISGMR